MQKFTKEDCIFMAHAIQLAKKGQYTTHPNPNVGCVIVKNNQIIGEGFHPKAGLGHAEVFALNKAGSNAKGATAYVTLEPCSHTGRTPPCAKALIKAGISKVIISMLDPNPKVSGSGKKMLEEAEIKVFSGLMSEVSENLNTGFLNRMRNKKPYVRLKLACSIDGKIALKNGESKWITGSSARSDVQRMRAKSHAILSTANTVLRDNASLNVRHNELGFLQDKYPIENLRQPIRVIIDRKQQIQTKNINLFNSDGKIWLASFDKHQITCDKNIILPENENWLENLMFELAKNEINDLWVEAGAGLAGSLLNQNLVDELIIYQAGKIMGNSSLGLFNLPEYTNMNEISQWQIIDQRRVGDDVKTIYHKK